MERALLKLKASLLLQGIVIVKSCKLLLSKLTAAITLIVDLVVALVATITVALVVIAAVLQPLAKLLPVNQ
jgi:hypothetical protein